MAPRTTPARIDAQRPSLTLLRRPDRRTEAEELRMEVHAAGSEMVAMSNRITAAIEADDMHSAHHFARRLGFLGQSYVDPDGRDAA